MEGKKDVDKKLSDVSGLVTTTVLNTNIKEVENKIPNVSGLAKKTNYNTKISDTEKSYFAAYVRTLFVWSY